MATLSSRRRSLLDRTGYISNHLFFNDLSNVQSILGTIQIDIEDLNHLFLNCVFLDQFDKIYFGGWVCIGFSLMLFLLLINFVELIYFVKDIMMCIEAIWLVTVWTIKKERNMEMFEQKESSCKKLIYNIKVQVWWYLKAKKTIFIMIYNLWMVQLLV
jgi:hypothetical protein